ncbi:MAG TPA: TetR family transcriptional regulator [Polyangiaceae bacterium]|nr:TetR family transcriptional regulator [Polyangiaceae bacterium]
MSTRRSRAFSPRKTPKQERSARLVAAILEAAIRVLKRDGAAAFTTVAVAERAGVSVGSLYQYFPNKEAILFRLQREEWEATGRLLDGILGDARFDAAKRLRRAMVAFFRTEFDEAPLRRALGDAAPLYRDAPEAREHRRRGLPVLGALVAEVAPALSPRQRSAAVDLYVSLLSAMGKHVSETARSRAEVDRWGAVTADMFLTYLRRSKRR